MIGTALNLLNVHPIFRYFVLQPPQFLSRIVRKQSKRNDVFAPATLGAFTIFIPCGTTQAMMALAVASGNPIAGAAILFAFVLGTSPVFFVLGYFTMKLGDVLQQKFMEVAAVTLMLLAFFNLEATLHLTGTGYTFSNFFKQAGCLISYCANDQQAAVTEQTITITESGYSPTSFAVPKGQTIRINLVNTNGFGCMQAFTVPALNIQEIVAPNQTKVISFIAPEKPGNIAFMCSMGMYTGTIQVVN